MPLRRPLVYILLYSSQNLLTDEFNFRYFDDTESISRYGPWSIRSRNFAKTLDQNPSPDWLLPIIKQTKYIKLNKLNKQLKYVNCYKKKLKKKNFKQSKQTVDQKI
ncbi:hypothetical protein Hanom_Chr14g01308231 [Helianthus anomalus]